MRKYYACIVTFAAALGACWGEIVGENIFVDSPVVFLNEDATPAANERVYIVEQIGISLVTDVLETDHEGRVSLQGYYSTPMVVAANGGGVVIRKDNLTKTHVVTLSDDRSPTLESGYGVPDPSLSRRPRLAVHGCAG